MQISFLYARILRGQGGFLHEEIRSNLKQVNDFFEQLLSRRCVIFIVACLPFAPHNTPFSQDGLRLSQLIMKIFQKLLYNSCRRLSQPRDKASRSTLYLSLVKKVVSKLRTAATIVLTIMLNAVNHDMNHMRTWLYLACTPFPRRLLTYFLPNLAE